jgi:twinfilin-like protein
VREAEALEAKRTALDPENEARRRKAVVGLGGKMPWAEGVQEAMDKVAQRSDDGWVVCLVSDCAHAQSQYEICVNDVLLMI